ncbi:MAG: LpxI family protein [Marinosulfonomonas sp.]
MLALIAGQGRLPALLYQALAEQGAAPHVAELLEHPADIPGVTPQVFRVEHLGSFLKSLLERGVTEVCFAGSIARPALDPAAIDADTMPLVPQMMAAISAGDDGALRGVLAIFEGFGLGIRAAHEILPDLLPIPGSLTQKSPSNRDMSDAIRGAAIVAAMGAADTGQACVVAAGQALAIEALGGTDWMLGTLAGENRPNGPNGGILFKAAKPDQDRRIDLPVIGPETVRLAQQAGLDGIVIPAGNVMVLDPVDTIKEADRLGLFLWVEGPG